MRILKHHSLASVHDATGCSPFAILPALTVVSIPACRQTALRRSASGWKYHVLGGAEEQQCSTGDIGLTSSLLSALLRATAGRREAAITAAAHLDEKDS